MDWRNWIQQSLDVILRVPPLFIIDSILKGTFLWPWGPVDFHSISLKLFWHGFNFMCLVGACCLFVLDTLPLVNTHRFLASGANLFFSYYFNTWYVTEELKQQPYTDDIWIIITHPPHNFLLNLVIQIAISLAYNCFQIRLSTEEHGNVAANAVSYLRRLRCGTYPVLLIPLLLRLLSVSPQVLIISPFMVCMFMCLEFKLLLIANIRTAFMLIVDSYKSARETIRNLGIQTFIEVHWVRLYIPFVLRLFWVVRTVYVLAYTSVEHYHKREVTDIDGYINPMKQYEFSPISSELNGTYYHYMSNRPNSDISTSVHHHHHFLANSSTKNSTVINQIYSVCEETLCLSCDTTVALMGMTSVVSYIAHYVGIALTWYVQSNNEEDRSLGTMTAILFFVLALQTGLTSMHPAKRIVRLYRNFCLLFTAVLHFVHGMVNPLLMNLSASQHHRLERHYRPLSMCVFLVTFPVFFLSYLWQDNTVSTWLLAVTAFSVEVVIKVFVSLLVYTLFMIDAYRQIFWEKLDDYVYYVKACGNTIEFVFGIFLFCNGAWIMVFESGGTIRAIMMCIHAYFNIWVQAKEGWKTFIKRRTAVQKINSLPEASPEQLAILNDVCAICYQDLNTARVTRCNHYFHGMCLRKWLYMQDVCPMCHEEIYAMVSDPEEEEAGTGGGQEGAAHNGGVNGVVPRVQNN